MALARIGLGANLGDPRATIGRAFDELERLGRLRRRSRLYGSKPWGVADQPPFVNAAAVLETDLSPHELLAALKEIEARLGRRPAERWGPREIDLDILAYDDLELAAPDLTIPHPRLGERAFALAPLADIDAAFAPALARLSPDARAEAWPLDETPARPAAGAGERAGDDV